MNRQKIGQILFWLGIVGLFVNYFVIWIRRPIYVANTAAELSGTFWDPNGAVFLIVGQSLLLGLGFSMIGALLYAGKIVALIAVPVCFLLSISIRKIPYASRVLG